MGAEVRSVAPICCANESRLFMFKAARWRLALNPEHPNTVNRDDLPLKGRSRHPAFRI